MRKVLVVVDMQNDFVTGVLGSEYAQAIVPNVVEKIKEYLYNDDYVICTQDTHIKNNYLTNTREGAHLPIEHCISGTEGHKLIKEIAVLKNSLQVIKYDQFGLSQFELETIDGRCGENVGSIEVVGIATNLCVLSVAVCLQNHYKNAEITIDAGCCASYDPVLHEKALDVLEGLQFNVINRK